MTCDLLLAIDLSSTCTGWALFEIPSKELVTSGIIKGKTFRKVDRWTAILLKTEYMADQIALIINNYQPKQIVIEEIAGSKNRIGQKTLDIQHGILWKRIEVELPKVEYYDVTGKDGWRFHMGLKLNDADKAANKEARLLNKKIAKGSTKLPIVNNKTLACRYVNHFYGKALDADERTTDADEADAICVGHAYLRYRMGG